VRPFLKEYQKLKATMIRRGMLRLQGTVQNQARSMSSSMKEINSFLVDEQLHADEISNSLLQQVRVHFEDVTFPSYLVLLAQAKGITGMKSAFIYNQETGCVSESELKMSVYEHGQFLSPDQKSKLMKSIDSLSKYDHQVNDDYLSLALCTACIDISANTSNATILMA